MRARTAGPPDEDEHEHEHAVLELVWGDEQCVSSGAQAQLPKHTFTQVNEHVVHTVT